jgi:serine/threonine protein phosphatase PrpC
VRFYGIFDGHGDFGKEASVLANQEFEAFIRGNIKKILKMKDLKDYKERVKKLLKVMYIDCQKKYERNVS